MTLALAGLVAGFVHVLSGPDHLVAMAHGLAGSSHVLGIAPALLLPSDFSAATYLLLFGAGSVVAMGTLLRSG